jgi:selenocysteine-specific elongation factor
MLIATAGHIDHGKTTLVRALTGVDTDRLPEEKSRGISIELGYAYAPLPGGELLGIVDVPGHERFVRTMIAGLCGIEFALLVVAADDGVMPQTQEHLAILGLIGVSQGVVALSKADRVDAQRLQAVREQVSHMLAGTALRAAPLFALDATQPDDPGTASLRDYLYGSAARVPARRDQRLFRMAVDRVFTLAGHGTVATGTVLSGQVATGDTVHVMPSGMAVRVRSIHMQNRPSERGDSGQRCALNLVGVDRSAIARGDWLAEPGLLAPTTRMDVRLRLLPDGAHRLESGSPVHVHLGTAHRVARLILLESSGVSAGESTRAQLVFDAPLCGISGDRFIVRDAQALRTVGGGVVLDAFAPARKRRSVERMRHLDALEAMIAGPGIGPLLQVAPYGVKMSELVRWTGLSSERTPLPPEAVTIDGARERYVISASSWSALRERAVGVLRDFHTRMPDEPGPDVGRLRRMAVPALVEPLWRALIDELARERIVIRSGPWLHLPGHIVLLSADDQALAYRLQPLMASGRFDPPWVRELAASVQEPEERVRAVLRKRVTQGGAYQIVRDLFYDAERIGELAAIVSALAEQHGAVSATQYRDAVGLGRKRAIQILEFFDRVGYTRRVQDAHVVRQDSGWRASG